MSDFTIYLGNKNYSSWSLRGWLMLAATGVAHEEVVIPLDERATRETILRYTPSGRVPVLHHGNRRIWDSLAIGEYLAEIVPAARLWPVARGTRARARSVSAEMHSGFADLRADMPMNIRASAPGKGMTAGAQADINRITAIWRDCRERHGGKSAEDRGFLFGGFTIADAMFAPVVSRLRTYEVAVDETSRAYMDAVWTLEIMKDWCRDAGDEPQIIESGEL